MGAAQVLPVGLEEVAAIAALARQADIDEIEGGLGLDIAEVLRQGISNSVVARKIVADGRVLAVFGDAAHDDRTGVPWLISTIHVNFSPRQFLKVCRPEVAKMLCRHEYLLNFVDTRNTQAIRWLKWLGFVFGDAVDYGPNGFKFYPFHMIRGL